MGEKARVCGSPLLLEFGEALLPVPPVCPEGWSDADFDELVELIADIDEVPNELPFMLPVDMFPVLPTPANV